MADPKSIHEFESGEGALGSLFLMDSPDQQASSGYTTKKLAMTDIGDFLNNEMEYTQDLDTEDKKISGALNELHGVDGFDVYDETTTSANKYEQGDICIHSNSLQVCTDANGAYGAWDSSKWSPTTIKALLALKQDELTTTTPTCAYTIAIQSGGIYAYKYGKILVVTGWLMPTYDKVANDTIAYVSGERVLAVFFSSPNSSNGLNGRLKMINQNNQVEIVCESSLKNTDYYSFTLVGVVQ